LLLIKQFFTIVLIWNFSAAAFSSPDSSDLERLMRGYSCLELQATVQLAHRLGLSLNRSEYSRAIQNFFPTKPRQPIGEEAVLSYLKENIPPGLMARLGRRYAFVFDAFSSGRVKKANFEVFPDELLGSLYLHDREIIINLNWANKISPVTILIVLAHEVRHINTMDGFLKRRPVHAYSGMKVNDFVAKNIESFLINESISRYGDHLAIADLLADPDLRPFAAELLALSSTRREVEMWLLNSNPKPGKDTLFKITELLTSHEHYINSADSFLRRFYQDFTYDSGDIGTASGRSFSEILQR
jgi:hypothetical protein